MKKNKKQEVTLAEYSKKMEEIIERGKSVSDTLVALLEEASKYKIKDSK